MSVSFTSASFVQNFHDITTKATKNGRVSNANLNKLNKTLVKANNSLHELTASQFETLQTDSNKLGKLIKGQKSKQETKKLNKNTDTLKTIRQNLTAEVREKIDYTCMLHHSDKLVKAMKTINSMIPVLEKKIEEYKEKICYSLDRLPNKAAREKAIKLIDSDDYQRFSEKYASSYGYGDVPVIVETNNGNQRRYVPSPEKEVWLSLKSQAKDLVIARNGLDRAEELSIMPQRELLCTFNMNDDKVLLSGAQRLLLKLAKNLDSIYR